MKYGPVMGWLVVNGLPVGEEGGEVALAMAFGDTLEIGGGRGLPLKGLVKVAQTGI